MGKTVLQNEKWHKTKAGNDGLLACGARVTPTVQPTGASLRKQRAICEGCKVAFAT